VIKDTIYNRPWNSAQMYRYLRTAFYKLSDVVPIFCTDLANTVQQKIAINCLSASRKVYTREQKCTI